ncbi:uncharacterized protein 7B2 [Chelonus insularis]|uniref:uncharacterized protein 7B2 n=1 Tax=Chelonus insularis TaxID=460826 RepID=UPI00158D8A67|nr:uncharacterized protein LOC118069770 [Chelonus insularis]
MLLMIGIFTIFMTVQGNMYLPPMKDHLLSDMLIRDIIKQMEKELADTADSYLEYQDIARETDDFDKAKEMPAEMPLDYEGIEVLNPNPSIRDQEYLQHSTLVSSQRLSQDGDSTHKIQPGGLKGIKEEKSENTLPAYCTPPNPCPIGYTSENSCLEEFENTAAFSRDYQSAQDCMCDSEHMLDCPNAEENDRGSLRNQISNSDFDKIVQLQESNPYFRGEKLPIAAKKGLHAFVY